MPEEFVRFAAGVSGPVLGKPFCVTLVNLHMPSLPSELSTAEYHSPKHELLLK